MITYDIETFPNCFLLCARDEYGTEATWEISPWRDDRASLLAWLRYLHDTQTMMVGFNNQHFDYPVVHLLWTQQDCTVEQLYAKAMAIVQGDDRFGHVIWPDQQLAPQVDLFLLHHFDNKAKSTGLKALQFAMRSPTLEDMPVQVGTMLTREQIDQYLIPYCLHDVRETDRFRIISQPMLDFRRGLIDQFGAQVMSWNDTKIGEKTLEKRLGDDVCYMLDERGRRVRRQTPRHRIPLADIIFPYIQFENPEFQRVHQFMLAQVLKPDELSDDDRIQTKGVLTGLTAEVGGLTFHFGTGGVHASVPRSRFTAADDWLIRDIDVEALYPSIAVANRLAPEHLGERFINEYASIPAERKKHPKGTPPNAMLKLAANGAWGKSNSMYSCFYDPKYAMTVPINGQLLICMLVEKLVTVPTLRLIQANTDGVTYMIRRDYEPHAKAWCDWWQAGTMLKLEDADYSHMWIRDVNNYVARSINGKVKLKGAYEYPDPERYHESITNMSPPGWHKDWSACVVQRAAVHAMLHGVDPEIYILECADPFDFMLRAKVPRSSELWIGQKQVQNTTRYYIATDGQPMHKIMPVKDGMVEGWPKKASGVSDQLYLAVMRETGGQWDERVCTKNKSVYAPTRTGIQQGWNVAECNDSSHFSWHRLDYSWYVAEARKLVIG